MKKKFMKLFAFATASVLCASVTTFNVNQAYAATDDATGDEPAPVSDTTFKMEEGASIRVSEQSGMRFRVEIGEDTKTLIEAADEFGFLIFPHMYLAEDANAGKADWHEKGIDDKGAEDYGLWDYVEVSVRTPDEIAKTIYEDEENGGYYANGVLHTVTDRNMEFSAIAFYKNDDTYTYAEFSEDFSRSLEYVAQQAYVAQPELRSSIKSTFDWFASTPIKITSGTDMKRLSAAVKGDTEKEIAPSSFEGDKFQLAKTIAVGSDYEAVPANFAGTWDWNGKALLLVDNAAGKGFESADYNVTAERHADAYYYKNGVAVMSSKLIDASTAKFTDNGINKVGDNLTVAVEPNENATGTDFRAVYTGASVWVNYGTDTGSTKHKNIYLSIYTNGWVLPMNTTSAFNAGCRAEVEAMKELYDCVKFRFYVEYNVNSSMWASANYVSIFSAADYTTSKNPFPEGYWVEMTLTIDELLSMCSTRDKNLALNGTTVDNANTGVKLLPLGRLSWYFEYSQNFYVGDCEFVKS